MAEFLVSEKMRDFSEEIDKAIDLLLKVSEHQDKKKSLLDKDKIVYLQVVLFKIPFGPLRKRKYLKLCHSLYGDDPEICLFVPNRKTGVKYKKTSEELIDFCIDHYTELLEKHKVKGVTTVMPLKQLTSEYGTYDLRRKLVHRFDLFLCKNSLLYNTRFLSSLGKIFSLAKKEPLGIPFPKENVDFDPEFQKSIERAIFTSSFSISRFSDNYSIPFGCLRNTKSELKENLQSVLNQIFTQGIIPGGLKNVRAMNLWPSQSKPVPFYISAELPVNMKTPRVNSKKKRLRGIEGEISTQPHKKVFVMQNGEVFVTKINKNSPTLEVSDSEDEDSFVDDSDDEEIEEKKKQNVKGKDKKTAIEEEARNEGESLSEDDEEIEKKEIRLLEGKMLAEEEEEENSYKRFQILKKTGEKAKKKNLNSKQNIMCAQKDSKKNFKPNPRIKKNKLKKSKTSAAKILIKQK